MIAICSNPFRDLNYELAAKAARILETEGFSTVICQVFGTDEEAPVPAHLTVSKLEEHIHECEMAVVIGGDGTILAVSRTLRDTGVPIFGVNLGTLGFMASVEPDHLEDIRKAARGECVLSRRMMLDVNLLRGGEVILSDTALNDAVIHGYGDCITISARSGDCHITKFEGDGIIVSTPTGSTGYSLSAGGPILEPDVENIVITPVCPHVYGARSFVLNADRCIEVHAERLHGRHAFLSVDGTRNVDILPGDVLHVKKSGKYTTMAFLDPNSFFDNTYEKLT